ncbi:hypothetical protein KC331_g3697 [Hortaea werneckii]|nr:hypothetical protein KC331_g3697 [Hortaea werneckii]KAI7715318.1 hypothetical protein KC353_g6176 [Hortaea werneckii]
MSGYIKGNVRPHLSISRVLNSETLDHRFNIGSYEAGMNHVVVDAHSQRHPVLGGEREGPQQQHQQGGAGQQGVVGGAPGGGNADDHDDDDGKGKDKHDDDDPDFPSDNHPSHTTVPNNLPNNNLPPNNVSPPSPFVRGRGHDPYGFFAAEAESKRRRTAKKAKWLARREVGRLRRWEEWRKGVWEPLVPPA